MDNNQFNQNNTVFDNNFEYSNSVSTFEKRKKQTNSRIIVFVVAVVCLVVLGYFIVSKILNNSDSKEQEDLTTSNAFYIYNGSSYALFSTEGKQLTDFIFEDDEEFYNHVAAVENEDGEYAIIKDNGEYVTKFGEYEYIYQDGTLFTLKDSDGIKYMNSEGKNIDVVDGKRYSITKPDSQEYIYLLKNDKDKEVRVLDYEGKLLDTLEMYDDLYTNDGMLTAGASVSKSKIYGTLYYGGNYYLYNLKTKERIMTSDNAIYISVDNGDGSIVVIKKEAGDNDIYTFLYDGKEKFTITEDVCKDFSIIDGGFVCKDYLLKLVDNNGKVVANNVKAYFDLNHYVKYDDGNYNFYSDGKEVLSSNFLSLTDDLQNVAYIVKNRRTYTYDYYDKNGEKMNSTSYSSAGEFDENNIAIVKEKGGAIYLVDTKFNKVSDDYDKISSKGFYYEGTKDGIYYLLKKDGTVALKEYNKSTVTDDKLLIEYDNKTVIYDSETLKQLVEIDANDVIVDDYYAYVTINGKKNYYSYENGKLFYTET